MTWQGRNLPTNWGALRRARFTLDAWRCVDCGHHDPTGRTLECDHIGHRDDHRLESLATRCGRLANDCHGARTAQQRADAIARRPQAARPPEPHPGVVRGRS